MDQWIADSAASIATRAERELEALVGVSTPSGDVPGAQEAAAIAAALLPDGAQVEHVPCSSPDHAPDLIARVRGTGAGRILLVGHLDTVVSHAEHRPLERDPANPDKLYGSGTVDMKGGDVLALGVLRALAGRPERLAEVALLLVVDEEWRVGPFGHVERFAGFDACLCFEAGELTAGGDDAVVVKRKAAGTVEVLATGRSAHSGSAPDRGVNALLALATAAQAIAAQHDPHGPDRLTAVPTVVRSGDAFNVVPAEGRLIADVRADRLEAFSRVLDAVPAAVGGAALTAGLAREWPGMDAREPTAPLLARAGELLGRPVIGAQRGGASDASHLAATIPLTVDGLGPRGGAAHNPGEFVLASSLRSRAQVALAVALAAAERARA
ncbi:MAG TPA: M20/M25/M40 family metallo-hydrolase [Baekduia sp.]|uniref:M20/M25/M40 family metallo-hydrolase n=1 Tax=Baekduia sp. TaxID=2600305 RepID=UPI002D141311|nr:M20/M25/M40 family metallo-hydrolase [Baekduia sp.]HMJ37088.1 M20/M25/M40 family metallo-hydrolase [Baekduia sp.]